MVILKTINEEDENFAKFIRVGIFSRIFERFAVLQVCLWMCVIVLCWFSRGLACENAA